MANPAMTLGEKESAPPDLAPTESRAAGIDPVRLAVALGVFDELDRLPVDHPDAVAVRRATARLYKTVKLRNRKARRDEVVAADEAVTAATATATNTSCGPARANCAHPASRSTCTTI